MKTWHSRRGTPLLSRGSVFVSRASAFSSRGASALSAAIKMLQGEVDGLALDFTAIGTSTSGSAAVKDSTTIANRFDGAPQDLLTYSGSSAKWVWNAAGVLVESAAGTLPIDHHPTTNAVKGLLVEEQRTNLLLRSQEFDNASWTKIVATVSANATAAPDGATTADALIPNSGAGILPYLLQSSSVASGAAHTLSFYLKQGTLGTDWALITVLSTSTWRAWFNLATGVKGTSAGSPTAYTITDVGNGFYRCDITVTTGTTTADCFVQPIDGDGTLGGINGDGVNPCFYVWQAQLEAGSFATSPIPTTTATVTRAADAVTLATSAFPWSATDGTIYIEADSLETGADHIALQVDDGTANERLALRLSSTGNARQFVVDGGATQVDASTTEAITADTVFEIRGAFKANDFGVTMDGGAVVTDAAGTMPTVTTLRLGAHSVGGDELNGHIKRLAYVPRRVTDADLPTWQD